MSIKQEEEATAAVNNRSESMVYFLIGEFVFNSPFYLIFYFLKLFKEPSFWISVRFLLSMLIFFGYCFNYMQKVDMGIAIVCMVNNTALKEMSYSYHFKNDTTFTPSNYSFDSQCQTINSTKTKKFVSIN